MDSRFNQGGAQLVNLLLLDMKFSQLAAVLTVLCLSYGEIEECAATAFQEECAGKGNLTAGVRLFRLASARRDVSRLLCKGGL